MGLDCRPFIIAEMSGSHNQSLERALSTVEVAAKSDTFALKIQTCSADNQNAGYRQNSKIRAIHTFKKVSIIN